MSLLSILTTTFDLCLVGVFLLTCWFYICMFKLFTRLSTSDLLNQPIHFFRDDQSIDAEIKHHRAIANSNFFNAKNIGQRLALRARPNRRLVTVFGINNSFTTTDVERHRDFSRLCENLIAFRQNSTAQVSDSDKWTDARTMARYHLSCQAKSDGYPIAEIVRTICFIVVTQVVLPFRIKTPEHVYAVTEKVNELWLRFKTGPDDDDEDEEMVQESIKLRSDLADMFEDVSFDEFHALDMIMAAYEPLWRVVLLTYVHVAFRNVSENTQDIVDEVVSIVGDGPHVEFNKDVTLFSKEALRLYPPVKRIYRAADVESLHHNKEIWGKDSMEFKPDRFQKLTKRQRDAYMPSGVDSHTCPAAGGFAEKLIAVLVVELIQEFGMERSGSRFMVAIDSREDGVSVNMQERELERLMSEPLPTSRADQADWRILT